MVLVTGATGLVGSHLLFKLLKEHETVKAIYRRPHKLKVVEHVFSYYTEDVKAYYNRIEWIEADINDIVKLETAFRNVDKVYHCAAFVSFEPDKYHQLRKINIEGTANIVNLCITNQIQKLCYVSSIAAIGSNENLSKPITEETEWNAAKDNSVYAITKYGAEMEVWRGSQEGVDIVVVNPGVIIGPGLWHGGGSSGIFKKVYKGMLYYTKGSTGYIDVNDVVDIMVYFMESDINNERFILVTETMSYEDFITSIANELNVKAPKKEASSFLLSLGWRLDWLKHKLTGKRRTMSKQMAQSLVTKTNYDNEKLLKHYPKKLTDIDESIKKTAKMFLKDFESNS